MNIRTHRYRVTKNILAITALLLALVPNSFAAAEVLRLNPGESRIIKTDFDINTIAVGDPEICDVTRVGPREVLLNAIAIGATNVLIWDKTEVKQEIDVTVGNPKSTEETAKEVSELVKNIEGVTVRIAGEKVIIEGSVFSRADLHTINNIAEGRQELVNSVAISPILRKVEAAEIEKAIGRKGIHVRPTENGFLLQGEVDTEAEMKRIEAVAQSFTENVVSALGIKKTIVALPLDDEIGGALIQVDINVIEIERDALADLSSASTVSGGIEINAASDANDTLSGVLNIDEPNFRKLQDTGKARSLMQQTVVTLSNQRGVAFMGEEFPVTTTQEGGEVSTDYKKIGLTLDVLPIAFKGDIVDMTIAVESTSVTGEARGGAPILSSVQLNTSTSLLSGESIALAGVLKQRVSQSFFGNASRNKPKIDPIDSEENTGWGETYSTSESEPNRYLNQQNHVLIIVSPKILDLPQEAIDRLGPEIQKSFKEYEYEESKSK